MKCLVLGAGGQLGREFSRYPVPLLERSQADLENEEQLEQVLRRYRPSVVINAAAYTAVDQAEDEPERAFAVNEHGCTRLARLCQTLECALIHFSTDYVFDGQGTRPYRESDSTAPLNCYGASKLAGEKAIAEQCERHVILRVSWLFGAYGRNFAKTVLRLAGERDELRIVADQHGCPCSTANVADAAWHIARALQDGAEHYGTYHYADQPATTWHGFAEALVREARSSDLELKCRKVTPISTDEFPTRARRPAYSVLDPSLLEKTWGLRPRGWEERLKDVVVGARA